MNNRKLLVMNVIIFIAFISVVSMGIYKSRSIQGDFAGKSAKNPVSDVEFDYFLITNKLGNGSRLKITAVDHADEENEEDEREQEQDEIKPEEVMLEQSAPEITDEPEPAAEAPEPDDSTVLQKRNEQHDQQRAGRDSVPGNVSRQAETSERTAPKKEPASRKNSESKQPEEQKRSPKTAVEEQPAENKNSSREQEDKTEKKTDSNEEDNKKADSREDQQETNLEEETDEQSDQADDQEGEEKE